MSQGRASGFRWDSLDLVKTFKAHDTIMAAPVSREKEH